MKTWDPRPMMLCRLRTLWGPRTQDAKAYEDPGPLTVWRNLGTRTLWGPMPKTLLWVPRSLWGHRSQEPTEWTQDPRHYEDPKPFKDPKPRTLWRGPKIQDPISIQDPVEGIRIPSKSEKLFLYLFLRLGTCFWINFTVSKLAIIVAFALLFCRKVEYQLNLFLWISRLYFTRWIELNYLKT